ncbi:glycosyltransferase family 4 protein [Zoogloea sp.]|uniref:glycosyltransferase family 4 protein n=1 Tax=Zoogloea sp. TaxID=49181 RepID=UPI0026089165|nr:glycosyltransferase family 4 protein [Zoogloea sp.]
MKKALFITTIGLVKESGGVRYSKSILEAMSGDYDVSLLVLSDVQLFGSRFLRLFFSILFGLFRLLPPNVIFHSGALSRIPREFRSAHWDLVVIDHLEAAVAREIFSSKMQIYIAHNIESELIAYKLSKIPRFFREIYRKWVMRFEIGLVKSVDGVVTISSAEASWFRKFCGNVATIYPVFNVNVLSGSLSVTSGRKLRLGFLGEAGWRPNREAVDILVDEILPLVSREVDVVFAGSGWGDSQIQKSMRDRQPRCANFEFPGYIPDIKDYWSSIDVFVAPIVSGAGVNVKICEALSNGVFVVALPHAVRGLNDRILECGGVVVVGTKEAFAGAIDNVALENCEFNPPVEFSLGYAVSEWKRLTQ